MATLFTTTFNTDTVGALPSGFVNKVGTWTVQSIDGKQVLASSSHVDGDAVLYTGIAARADMGVRTDVTIINNVTSASRLPVVSHILRSDAAYSNCYLVVLQDGEDADANQLHFEVYKKVGGSISLVSTSPNVLTSSPPVNGDVYHMRSVIVGSAITVYLWKNSDSTPSSPTYSTSNANVTANGYGGLYNSLLATNLVPYTDNFTIDDAAASATVSFSLTGASSGDGYVFQRSGTTATVAFTGSYTGSPAQIEARLVGATSGLPLSEFDWSTKVVSPSGGVFSLSFASVPQGGFYKVQIRDSADTATVTSPTNTFGVGARVILIGQSNIETLSMYNSGTPSAMLRMYDRYRNVGLWSSSTVGTGAINLGNLLVTALGGSIPVALIQYAVSGAGLHAGTGFGTPTSGGVARYWLDLTASAGTPWYDFTTAIGVIGTGCELVVYGQGESDAMSNISVGTYGADLTTLFSRIRTLLGAGVKIILPLLGQTNVTATSATAWDTVRQAQIATALSDGNSTTVSKQDLQCDAASPDMSAAQLEVWGTRLGQKIAYTMGLVPYGDGPSISSLTAVSSTVYEITLTPQGGTDITPVGPTQIVDLLFRDSTAATITPTDLTRFSATKIRATFATAPSTPITVQSSFGKVPATQVGIVRDNTALTLPLQSSAQRTAGASLATTASVTLYTSASTPAASLSGLKWQYQDSFGGVIISTGSSGSTNGTGLITVPITGTARSPGGTGWLEVTNSDGTVAGRPTAFAFSGPVTVA